jgi:hypothetical protein
VGALAGWLEGWGRLMADMTVLQAASSHHAGTDMTSTLSRGYCEWGWGGVGEQYAVGCSKAAVMD